MDDVITCTADDIDLPYVRRDLELPDHCQQFGCGRPAETWCPLCRSYFCHFHDELYPRRRHDCLRGTADDDDESLRAREVWRS